MVDIFKSDVFSLGMCMLDLCILGSCEQCYDYEESIILSEDLRDKFNSLVGVYSRELLNLIYEMLSFDLEIRPSFLSLEKYLNEMG